MSFLAIDIGNTNIVMGVLDEEYIRVSCTLGTDRNKTGDEYAVLFRNLLEIHKIPVEELEGGILSTVVPSLREPMREAVRHLTGKPCLVVGPGLKNGLKIRIDDPAQLGSDCVAVAVAAAAEYPLPALIFDMGTATTLSVLNAKGEYQGGMLMPGVRIGLEALAEQTSQLPLVSLDERPRGLIGSNSIDCMVSGILYGNAAMIDGVVERLRDELGDVKTILATGGISAQIVPYCKENVIYDKDLLLKGLRRIYLKNKA